MSDETMNVERAAEVGSHAHFGPQAFYCVFFSSSLLFEKATVDSKLIFHVRMKLHEDWASTPAAIDSCLRVADKYDVQVMIHTDTLNESGCVEHTLQAFKGRTVHAYHAEGAGGGHAPDLITVCGIPNVIPSSTNPTKPYSRNTMDEAMDMLLICHHLDKSVPHGVRNSQSVC